MVQLVNRLRFDEEQSRRIGATATELCGFGQVSAYYMVAASRALAAVAERHGRRVEVLRIPLSVNLRKVGGDGPMIGNQLTFVELLLCEDELADRTRLAASIQKQYVDAIREGRDVERELPRLATYLGHVHVNDTYWYLEAVPELLQLATERVMQCREEAAR